MTPLQVADHVKKIPIVECMYWMSYSTVMWTYWCDVLFNHTTQLISLKYVCDRRINENTGAYESREQCEGESD